MDDYHGLVSESVLHDAISDMVLGRETEIEEKKIRKSMNNEKGEGEADEVRGGDRRDAAAV